VRVSSLVNGSFHRAFQRNIHEVGDETKGRVGDFDNRVKTWSNVANEGKHGVVETGGGFAWYIQISHEAVNNTHHMCVPTCGEA
jgi:hypothetical protein